jgi:hypothetical protein
MTDPAAKRVCTGGLTAADFFALGLPAKGHLVILEDPDYDGDFDEAKLDPAVLAALVGMFGGADETFGLQVTFREQVEDETDGPVHRVFGRLAWTILRLLTCSTPAVPGEQVVARALRLFASGRMLRLYGPPGLMPEGTWMRLQDFFCCLGNTAYLHEVKTRLAPTTVTLDAACPFDCSELAVDFLPPADQF